jgi:hypothetical protein
MDFSKLSDSDLQQIAKGDMRMVSTKGLQMLSGDEPQANQGDGFFDDMSIKNVPQNLGNLGAGLVRGAGSIGATILAPWDIAQDAMAGKGLSLESNRARRKEMDYGFQAMGSNPDSGLYSIGKIGGEIAGTAGIGNVLAGAKILANAPKLANAIRGGGLGDDAGNLLTRITGGSIAGGAGAGLIDPNSAGTGALFGGAIPILGKALPMLGRGIANVVGGIGTHTGGESIKQAAKAGFEGGKRLNTVLDNMHGNVPMTNVLDDVNANLQKLGQDKSAQYRSGMIDISKDKTILDFTNIDDSIARSLNSTMFKGKITKPSENEVLVKVKSIIDDWKLGSPSDYHTPEGMDALKQQVGDVLEGLSFEKTNARRVVGDIYSSIKNDIAEQAPTYSKVMKDYGDASDYIKEIRGALVGGKKSTADSSMRKLQTIMRNNANTGYGNRLDMAKKMAQGGKDILPALAGQSLNSWTPRGLGGAVATGIMAGGLLNPAILAALIPQSPRLIGYGAIGSGLLGRGVNEAVKPAIPAIGALSNALYQYNNQ